MIDVTVTINNMTFLFPECDVAENVTSLKSAFFFYLDLGYIFKRVTLHRGLIFPYFCDHSYQTKLIFFLLYSLVDFRGSCNLNGISLKPGLSKFLKISR